MGITRREIISYKNIALEFNKRDIFIGVCWCRGLILGLEPARLRNKLNVWVCIIPLFPIHFRIVWDKKEDKLPR